MCRNPVGLGAKRVLIVMVAHRNVRVRGFYLAGRRNAAPVGAAAGPTAWPRRRRQEGRALLTVLDALFDGRVATALSLTPPMAGVLTAAEWTAARSFGARRLSEFRHGRQCARYACRRLGIGDEGSIGVGPDREPLWPAGLVGSISHAGHHAAAAVGRAGDLRSIGVDIEPAVPLPAEILDTVCRPEEIERLREHGPAAVHLPRATLVFSAKEAAYKALWPLLGRFLEFHDLEIALQESAGRFNVISHAADCPATLAGQLRGHYLEVHGLFATGVSLDHPER